MIGFQETVINNNVSIVELAKEIGISPSAIWRWFNVNKVPTKYHDFICKKFDIDKSYINRIINNISTHTSREKEFNTYRIEGNIVYIELINKKGIIKETLVDLEDLEKLINLGLHWGYRFEDNNNQYYAVAQKRYIDENGEKRGTTVHLHRIIMDVYDKDITVDHKEADKTLDNRKENLRIVTSDKNSSNRKGANKNSTTGHRNVNWGRNHEEYWVQFSKLGVKYKWEFPLSQFKEACDFADIKRVEIFGEYAGKGK